MYIEKLSSPIGRLHEFSVLSPQCGLYWYVFFLLHGLLDRSGSRSELVFYWQESGEADFLQSKQSSELRLFTGQVAHVFMSTWKTGDCRVENGAIHTIVFINRQQFHESLVCAAVGSIALDVLWLVPLTVPTLLTLIRVTLGILITCTLHVPHHLEFTRVIRP